jgi:hypothetical protein
MPDTPTISMPQSTSRSKIDTAPTPAKMIHKHQNIFINRKKQPPANSCNQSAKTHTPTHSTPIIYSASSQPNPKPYYSLPSPNNPIN